jgi:hypothetical protein
MRSVLTSGFVNNPHRQSSFGSWRRARRMGNTIAREEMRKATETLALSQTICPAHPLTSSYRQPHGPNGEGGDAKQYPDWCVGPSDYHKRARRIIDHADKTYPKGRGCSNCVRQARRCVTSVNFTCCAACTARGNSGGTCNLKYLRQERSS